MEGEGREGCGGREAGCGRREGGGGMSGKGCGRREEVLVVVLEPAAVVAVGTGGDGTGVLVLVVVHVSYVVCHVVWCGVVCVVAAAGPIHLL